MTSQSNASQKFKPVKSEYKVSSEADCFKEYLTSSFQTNALCKQL